MNTSFTPQNANFISLESIHIATPCRADWNKMQGISGEANDCARHCQSCDKNVYNLSAMTRDEAGRLILQHEGNLCVQLHRRADGTVITSDCPVGISPVRKPAKWLGAALGTAAAAILAIFGVKSSWASKPQIQVTAGAPTMVMGEAPPMLMGRMVTPKATPKATPTVTPSKNYAKRASRKSNSKLNRGHR